MAPLLCSLGVMDIKPRIFPAGAAPAHSCLLVGGGTGLRVASPQHDGCCFTCLPSAAGALNIICNFAELVVREMERDKASTAS